MNNLLSTITINYFPWAKHKKTHKSQEEEVFSESLEYTSNNNENDV